jgi:C1A family cysteine protease
MKKYTWKPDLPDYRDHLYTATPRPTLPVKVDLRTNYNNIYDQGNLGSCTANAVALAFDFGRIKQSQQPIKPSRLFIYYNERLLEGTVRYDSGATLRNGIKTLNKQGTCIETEWPYVISKFAFRPTNNCYSSALNNTLKQYLRLNNANLNDLKTCLASGFGFVFGFSVYSSFETQQVATTGQVSLPQRGERLLGGHAVYCVGYDDSIQKFICRNSWGTNWGDKGHFYIPYSYLTNTNLADDFWTLRLV